MKPQACLLYVRWWGLRCDSLSSRGQRLIKFRLDTSYKEPVIEHLHWKNISHTSWTNDSNDEWLDKCRSVFFVYFFAHIYDFTTHTKTRSGDNKSNLILDTDSHHENPFYMIIYFPHCIMVFYVTMVSSLGIILHDKFKISYLPVS